MLTVLLERLPLPTGDLPELGAQRLEAVRATAKRAGIDSARLADGQLTQRDDGGSQVEVEVREPDAPRPSKFRETLRRLGVPLERTDAPR
jgi:D-alanyl-D-alanine carboxypeptidase